MNVEQSSFSGVVFNVSRLVRIKEVVRGKVFSKSRFNNTFDDFRYQRKIRNGTVVRELGSRDEIKIRFLSRGDIVDCLRVGWTHQSLQTD